MTRARSPVMVWFRDDLRLADNAALDAAAVADGPVLACYVLDSASGPDVGGASRWWLHHSLAGLQRQLRALGGRLILRRGPAAKVLPGLAGETGAGEIHCVGSYGPARTRLDQPVETALGHAGVALHRHRGSLLFEPDAIRNRAGEPFRVFTPFWKTCLQTGSPGPPMAAPKELRFFDGAVRSDPLEDWRLLPTEPDWAAGLRESWRPGEAQAHERLQDFLEQGMSAYAEGRDRPDRSATSRLSPHLHFGELSPRQVWHAAHSVMAADARARRGGEAFLRQLGWREFCYHLLEHWPSLPEKPFRPEFEAFPWRADADALAIWQRGETGYALVDAGMRELWHTGWMHNRVRMVAASFLVKHLLIPWQQGAEWFWDTLVDADLANNAASWQWVAGSGADAAPYFRIFNPVLQGKKFDPQGSYVRRWVPELAALPAQHVHEPAAAPEAVLREAGIVLGRDYPLPVIDHAVARRRALDAYERLKQRSR